ncbi:hypothetical protein ACQR0Z_19160 [Bradyrhizobium sp. HKCCYLS3077]|uniref:hypothetical protein n=1 Tax=Bradyrhizobium sp. HKCCYLS3077 TaxID=3420761 RepID=UPI003EBA9183
MKIKSASTNDLNMQIVWRFTPDAIELTPEAAGVYAFFADDGELLLLGSATKSLRKIFRSHWMGYEGGVTCGATFIGWEINNAPLTREAELVRQYTRAHGRIPRRRMG